MRLALFLAALLAPFLFAAAMVGVLRIAGRESRREEVRAPRCPYCEFRGLVCRHVTHA